MRMAHNSGPFWRYFRRMTLSDTVEKSLKKGKSVEVSAAADLAVLICLQLADVSGVELVYSELRHTLATLVADNAQPATARAKVRCRLAVTAGLSRQLGRRSARDGRGPLGRHGSECPANC